MARRKKQSETKQEIKEEITKSISSEPETTKPETEPVKEPVPPRNLNEYIQARLEEQQSALENAPRIRTVLQRDTKGNVKISVENANQPTVKKGRMLRNTIVTNSYTGWQRTLLAGTVVEIVNEFGNKVTVKAYGMLHTVTSKYIEKL